MGGKCQIITDLSNELSSLSIVSIYPEIIPTFVVTPDEFVSGVAGEVPGVAQSEAVPGPLDDPDLVVDSAGQGHLNSNISELNIQIYKYRGK